MRSRMERYSSSNDNSNYSRSDKNKELYQDLSSTTKYTNFTDVTNANAFDLNKAKENYRTREGYHKIKEYDDFVPTPKVKKELDEFNHLYQDHENRIYDINSVLEEARKNRIEKDKLEEKRKLKNTNYNILASLNKEELERYRREKETSREKPDEDELRELIDTITSKTLAGEIDKKTSVDLLSDLMATSVIDKVENPVELENEEKQVIKETDSDKDDKLSLSKEILDKEQIEKMKEKKTQEDKGIMEKADTEFYTRSMDLSDKDFDLEDEFKEKKVPTIIKALLALVLLAVIGVAIYFIWKSF